MKRFALIATLAALLAPLAFAQAAFNVDRDSQVAKTSGQVLTFVNRIGVLNLTFEELFNGSPTSATVTIQGCGRGNPASYNGAAGNGQGVQAQTCDLLDVYTTTTAVNSNRKITGLYDVYLVTPTFSGGSSPTVQVNLLESANSSPASQQLPLIFNNGYTAITSATTVKSAGGNLLGWMITNGVATACWLQVFNATSGNVTLGTTVPVISIPLALAVGGAVQQLPQFATIIAQFPTAISVAATTTPAGNTTCGTGATVQLWYQ